MRKYTLQIWHEDGSHLGTASSDFLHVIAAFGVGLPPSWKRHVEFAPPEPGEGAIWSWEKFLQIYNSRPTPDAQKAN